LASFFLHVPLGVSYIRALNADQGLTRGDIVKGAAYTVAFAAIAVAGPNIVGSDRNSPHAFTPAQMGPHDVEAAKEPPVTVRDLQATITSSLAASLQRLGSRAATRLGVTGVRTSHPA
jgi:hypothetical protein